MFCVRARLQSCRNRRNINVGFSPCGMLFADPGSAKAFFRSLFSPGGMFFLIFAEDLDFSRMAFKRAKNGRTERRPDKR
jgi:hypothetical protein